MTAPCPDIAMVNAAEDCPRCVGDVARDFVANIAAVSLNTESAWLCCVHLEHWVYDDEQVRTKTPLVEELAYVAKKKSMARSGDAEVTYMTKNSPRA
jgi:hypothetical protein